MVAGIGSGGMANGAGALIDVLHAAGVRRVYGVPGEHCLEISDAVEAIPDMMFVATRHEGGAAFMAEAEAKLTGVPGVCLGSAGVGASNLTLGVHTARQDSTPLIAIVGQIGTDWRHREAWQEVEIAEAYGPFAKWAVEVPRADRMYEFASRAVATALAPRRGPIVLSVPLDVQESQIGEQSIEPWPELESALATDAAEGLIDLLAQATAPVLLVGGGLAGGVASKELVAVAEATGTRVVTAFRRPDAFPNDHPAYVGPSGLGVTQAVTTALEDADVLVAFGTRLSELSTLRYAIPSLEQTFVHIDASPSVLTAGVRRPDRAFVADPVSAAQALAAAAGAHNTTSTFPHVDRPDLGSTRLAGFAEVLEEQLADDAIVTSDAGDFNIPFVKALRFTGNRRYIGPTAGAMGYGLPSAIAASLAAPGRQVVGLVGDGGLMMALGELETGVRLRSQMTLLVINNNQYGSIHRHQTDQFDGRYVGVMLENPSFAAVAEVFGATGVQLGNPGLLGAELNKARQRDGPTVLEIMTTGSG